jgi:Obg family GTPase CgtA-like protein
MLIHPQFDPVALAIGPLAVHWYGISYLAAFVLFIVLARRRLHHPPYAALQAQGFKVMAVSAVTREGLEPFLATLRERVAALPPPVIFTPAPVERVVSEPEPVVIERVGKVWQVRHAWLVRQVEQLNLESAEAVVRLHKLLDDFGVIDRLRELGVADHDTVAIGAFEFDFID